MRNTGAKEHVNITGVQSAKCRMWETTQNKQFLQNIKCKKRISEILTKCGNLV